MNVESQPHEDARGAHLVLYLTCFCANLAALIDQRAASATAVGRDPFQLTHSHRGGRREGARR